MAPQNVRGKQLTIGLLVAMFGAIGIIFWIGMSGGSTHVPGGPRTIEPQDAGAKAIDSGSSASAVDAAVNVTGTANVIGDAGTNSAPTNEPDAAR